jgi:hypothetical protein
MGMFWACGLVLAQDVYAFRGLGVKKTSLQAWDKAQADECETLCPIVYCSAVCSFILVSRRGRAIIEGMIERNIIL